MTTSRYRPRTVRRLLTALAIAAVAVLRLWWVISSDPAPGPLAEGEHAVQRVIDGDTLVLASGRRVRLQGIDTPEAARDGSPAEPLSREATEYSRAFVRQAGQVVRLTFTDERLDKYGRDLAFVWSEGRCLNEQLVREGLARARLDFRFSGAMRTTLRDAEAAARDEGRGIWSLAD